MKHYLILPVLLLTPILLLENGCVVAGGPPPPPPLVAEAYVPPPFVGAAWVGGYWGWHPEHRRYEWHHGEWRHHG